MKNDAAKTPTRPRSRKKAASAPIPAETVAEPGDDRNVSPLEGSLSVTAGVLFLIAAVFPRSIKQLLLLGLGSALVFRGTTHRCGVYHALGIDTTKEPLLKQINEKYLAPSASEEVAS